MSEGDCGKCEQLLQGYLDRELSSYEVEEAEEHLNGCDYCRRRYRFEESLRVYVRTTRRGAHAARPAREARPAPDDGPRRRLALAG